MKASVFRGTSLGELRETVGDVHALAALIERELDRRAFRSIDCLHDVHVSGPALFARAEPRDVQIADEEPNRMFHAQLAGNLAGDWNDRERHTIILDELLALGAEQLGDDERVRSDRG